MVIVEKQKNPKLKLRSQTINFKLDNIENSFIKNYSQNLSIIAWLKNGYNDRHYNLCGHWLLF